jgi:SNF2 family DNA or RNA helicase
MLIYKEKQAVLLKLHQPSRVTTVIPTAKLVNHEGNTLVAVPHRPDEARVLRQLGFDVPEPMKAYYNWPGQYKPFSAQIETSSFLTMNSRAFCLNSMGLGKTISALWAYDYMRSVKQAKRALVICPLSTMERAWADEIFRSFPDMTATVLYGTAKRRRKLLATKADIYIINTDGLATVKEDLASRGDINLVIVDEAALYRNQGTNRWKVLNTVINRQTPRRVWALTGAPTPNEPTDAWAQCRVITPANPELPKYFNKFREQVMRQVSPFKWVTRPGAAEVVANILKPSIRYALDDVLDLPEQITVTREVEMTPEQKVVYKDMVTKLRANFGGDPILAVNEAVKAGKLMQIACGVAYGHNGSEVVLPAAPRVDVVKEVIEESEGKVLVFVPFTSVLTHLAADLQAEFGFDAVEMVYGDVTKDARDKIYSAFQKRDEGPRVIVAAPGTMSHGLTLTAATTIIWFAPIYSNEIYEQACARVRRPGQSRTTVIVHISGSLVEKRCYERLKNKQRIQGTLLDLLEEEETI